MFFVSVLSESEEPRRGAYTGSRGFIWGRFYGRLYAYLWGS